MAIYSVLNQEGKREWTAHAYASFWYEDTPDGKRANLELAFNALIEAGFTTQNGLLVKGGMSIELSNYWLQIKTAGGTTGKKLYISSMWKDIRDAWDLLMPPPKASG
jgi:hypothetical protein